jgi:glutathione S-transferase
MRTVPTLEFEEGGMVRRLSQSLAIMEYLEERYRTPPLLPADPLLRARALRQLTWVTGPSSDEQRELIPLYEGVARAVEAHDRHRARPEAQQRQQVAVRHVRQVEPAVRDALVAEHELGGQRGMRAGHPDQQVRHQSTSA